MDWHKVKEKIVKYFWVSLTVAIAIFTIVVAVGTVDDIRRTNERRREIEPQIAELQAKITRDSSFIYNIQHSAEFVEKFARERFLMQREGEVVYILEE